MLDDDDDSEGTTAIRAFNDRVRSDERVVCVQTTIRDGVTLIRRGLSVRTANEVASGSWKRARPLPSSLELAAGAARQRLERLDDEAWPSSAVRSTRHVPATAPSTRNDADDCGIFVLKIRAPEALREDLRAACVDEQRGVPGRQEARRGGGVGGRQESAR